MVFHVLDVENDRKFDIALESFPHRAECGAAQEVPSIVVTSYWILVGQIALKCVFYWTAFDLVGIFKHEFS